MLQCDNEEHCSIIVLPHYHIIMKYEEAITELQNIVDGLENETIGMDELSEKMKRATELIQYCKGKLHKTREELENTNIKHQIPNQNNK